MEQRSPVAGGDIFGQYTRVTAPDTRCPMLSFGCRGQGRGQRAWRSDPAPFLLSEGEEETAQDAVVTGPNKTGAAHTHISVQGSSPVEMEQERLTVYTLPLQRGVTGQDYHPLPRLLL